MAEEPFDKKISMNMNDESNYLFQQKLGIEMELFQWKLCQVRLKDTEKTGWSKGGLQTCVILQEKRGIKPKVIQRSSELPLPPWAQG